MKKILGWIISLIIPFAIILTAVRLLLTPVFVNLEYHTPGFPEDSYGMTIEQRLEYAPLAMDYLLNDEDISFLGDQRFDDGTPLYNQRELSHMVDVKVLTQQFLDIWVLLLVLLLGTGAAAWHFGFLDDFRNWVARGGKITVIALVVAMVLIGVSFNALFTGFHSIFFEGDSWLFFYSDTLIRLFPLRFWRDVFIALAVLSLGAGALLWRYGPGKVVAKRKPKSRSAR
jgi:integral membrane protein (TIGR01906 family)